MAVCHYHPERAGIGVCMRCRVVVCTSCSTRVDGINHCHACLKSLGKAGDARRSGIPAALLAVVSLGMGGALFFLAAWIMQGRLAP